MLDIRLWEVGAGLSVRIRTPNGQNHIIDAGSSRDFSPAEHIKANHWRHGDVLDYLVISHTDADHYGDLPAVVRELGEPRFLLRNTSLPDFQKYGDETREYQRVYKALDTRYTSAVSWENDPINPDNNGGLRIEHAMLTWSEAGNINDSSIVVAYLYAQCLVVFPGDIENAGWLTLRRKKHNLFGDMMNLARWVILVAPHHGRRSGYSQDMIDYFKPNLVVISDGYGAGETDPRFRTAGTGLNVNTEPRKYITTKSNGRKKIVIEPHGRVVVSENDYNLAWL